MKVAIIARFELPKPALSGFLSLAKDVIAATRKEEGCELYSFSQDVLQPEVMWINEQWASEAALNRHLQSEHIAHFLAGISDIDFVGADVRKYEVDTVGTVTAPSS